MEEEIVAALRSEISELRASCETLIFAFDRMLNFALVFSVGGAGIALTKGHFIVMAVVPFPLAVIVGYLLSLNAEGLSRAGHKKYLEEKLNGILGDSVYLEESAVAPTRQGDHWFGRLGVVSMQLTVGLLLLGTFMLGLQAVLRDYHQYWILYAAAILLSIFSLVSSVRELSRAYGLAYKAARESDSGFTP
ncbi:hypothetical protein [Streptomyces sp. NBC_00576]|uniref:hypothetical protein n=1 Tax=Streptomyces sp. NBC_00576 TaxID=2903665 RepID=UPI002E8024B8|nr:hypothetical protein [Streptomyces sp. NBC_00576]WUB72930.1 hypothetical protein OG734_24070 [Streptomyces sp. NBC_00576]